MAAVLAGAAFVAGSILGWAAVDRDSGALLVAAWVLVTAGAAGAAFVAVRRLDSAATRTAAIAAFAAIGGAVLVPATVLSTATCTVGPGADLAGCDLADRDLTGEDLSLADLHDADLTGAHLAGVDLTGTDLTGTDLTGADLTGARLAGVDLRGATVDGAHLDAADLGSSLLAGLDLSTVGLTGADLSGAQLDGVDASGVDLTGATLAGADLTDAELDGAVLGGVDLTGAVLTRATLAGAVLAGADLTGALDVATARLDGADLSSAHLAGLDLRGVALGGAGLAAADISDANLDGADLRGADLSGALLGGTSAVGTQFDGAVLANAVLGLNDLTDAVGVTDEMLLAALGVAPDLLTAEVTARAIRFDPHDRIVGALAPVRDGSPAPGARPYDGSDSFHAAVVLGPGPDAFLPAWATGPSEAWMPTGVRFAELVVVERAATWETIEVCEYFSGGLPAPPITRYQAFTTVQILAASDGHLVAEQTFSGAEPRACRPSEPYSLTELRGDPPDLGPAVAWVTGYVHPPGS